MTSRPRPSAAPDDILDGLSHGCAFAAYVEVAITTGGPPPIEPTRRLAYRLYEEELARRTTTHSRNPQPERINP